MLLAIKRGVTITFCKRVTTSKYSRLFGLKLSVISLTFFLSNTFCLIAFNLIGDDLDFVQLLFYLTLAGNSLSVFTIYFQIKLKTWCPFCLSITMLLLLQMAILNWSAEAPFLHIIPIEPALFYAIIFGGVMIIYMILDGTLSEDLMLKRDSQILLFLMSNFQIVDPILRQQRSIKEEYSSIPSNFDFKAGTNSIKLLFVMNLKCPTCKKRYNTIKKLYRAFPNRIRLKIICFIDSDRDKVIGMSKCGGNELFELLDNLLLMNKEIVNDMPDPFYAMSVQMRIFVANNEIVNTPALFVENFEWPTYLESDWIKHYVLNKLYWHNV